MPLWPESVSSGIILKKEKPIKQKITRAFFSESAAPFFTRVWSWLGMLCGAGLISPVSGFAIQLHQGSEGIIVHQVGHVFFLLSMVVLVFIITGRQLNKEHGWRMIQISAILFVFWNLDTVLAHFFDNQVRAVTVENLSIWEVKISAMSGSELLVLFYHSLKLDHLLCVPALFCFYRGLSSLVSQERFRQDNLAVDKQGEENL